MTPRIRRSTGASNQSPQTPPQNRGGGAASSPYSTGTTPTGIITQSPTTTNDPSYPINRPYVAKVDFNPTADELQKGAIPLRIGDCGKILDHSPPQQNGQAWIYVTVPRREPKGTVRGWVSAAYVRIGNAIYGRFSIQLDTPELASGLTQKDIVADTQFTRAVNALCLAWSKNSHQLWLPEQVTAALKDKSKRHQIVSAVVQGITEARVKSVLDSPNFCVKDLHDAGKEVDTSDRDRPLIYLQILRNFKSDDKKLPVLRVGKTNNGWGRSRSHLSDMKSNPHYTLSKAYEDANDYCMLVLCYGMQDDVTRQVAEALFNSLLQTFRKYLFRTRPTTRQEGEDDTNSLKEGSSYANDLYFAEIMTRHDQNVFKDCGWPGGVRRDTFGASDGLNYVSPIHEEGTSYQHTLWTETDLPSMTVYRRSATTVVDDRATKIVYVSRHGSLGLRVCCAASVIPAGVKKVYPRFEIMKNSQPHPCPYARDPPLGPTSQWEEGNTVGFAADYLHPETGVWHELRVTTSTPFALINGQIPGSFRAHEKMLAYRRFFLQQTREKFQPWEIDFGLGRVKRIHFDVLTQTFIFSDNTSITKLGPAEWKPPHVWRHQLTQLGFQNFDMPWSGVREYCDYCFLARSTFTQNTAASLGPCSQHNDTNTCKVCYRFGRFCTWTSLRHSGAWTAAQMTMIRSIMSVNMPTSYSYPQSNPDIRFGTLVRVVEAVDDENDEGIEA